MKARKVLQVLSGGRYQWEGIRNGSKRANIVNIFVYENRRMKPVEIVLRCGGNKGERQRGQNKLSYIASTYINVTMYSLVQLLYTNENMFT
jgi:hypothetical protein